MAGRVLEVLWWLGCSEVQLLRVILPANTHWLEVQDTLELDIQFFGLQNAASARPE